MKTILLIHGPNLNRLGLRDEVHYGGFSLKDIEDLTRDHAKKFNVDLITYQSNHEGNLIDVLQLNSQGAHGIIINPGALTHYSYALHDALLDTHLPAIEVHLSDIENREPWRRQSVTAPACVKVISGKKEKGYIEAVSYLAEIIQNDKS
jgi:3-dehydroquinate dehydratase-2